MLLSTKTLRFKPSLLASAILLTSINAFNYTISPEELESCRQQFQWYSIESLSECAKAVKLCWVDMKLSTSSRHDAVNTKFSTQEIVKLKEVSLQNIPVSSLENWFYKPEPCWEEEHALMQIS